MTAKEFIQRYYKFATASVGKSGIFPSVSLAIAYLESNKPKGLSFLAEKYNNFHGIQNYPKFKGITVSLADNQKKDMRKFCTYPTVQAGFRGFVQFLQDNPRYAAAGVFQAKTPREQIQRIAKAGYSETSTWPQAVLGISDQVPQGTGRNTAIIDLLITFLTIFAIIESLLILERSLPDWKPGRKPEY